MLTLYVESKVNTQGNSSSAELRVGKIHFITLAGSDRLVDSMEGMVNKDTQNMNRSLVALGEVLHSLSLNTAIKNKANNSTTGNSDSVSNGTSETVSQIPYLNSHLTHLLKDSLGGNSKTVMIANVLSDSSHYHHNLITLMYASRAMKVHNRPRVNNFEITGDVLRSTSVSVTSEKELLGKLKLALMYSGAKSNLMRSPVAQKYIDMAQIINASTPQSKLLGDVVNSATNQQLSSLSESATPSRSGMRTWTLKIQSIQAQRLRYVAFPLCPILKIRVAHQEAITSKRIYIHSIAVFPEVFELEIIPDEFESGLSIEVVVVNISASTGLPVHVGEGFIEISKSSLPVNKRTTFTVNLSDLNSKSSGYLKLSAAVLDRPVEVSVLSPPPQYDQLNMDIPLTPSIADIQSKLTLSSKSGVLTVQSVLCFDLKFDSNFFSKNFGIFNGEYFVVVQVGKEIMRTKATSGKRKGRGASSTIVASFEKLKMHYDIAYDQLYRTSIYVTLFETSTSVSSSDQQYLGRANASLFSLEDRNDDINSAGSEFAMLLKDINNRPVGKVSLCLHMLNVKSAAAVTDNASLSTPGKHSSPSKYLRTKAMTPKLNNIQLPEFLQSGWIHINSVTATNLNKFRLVGNTAKYRNVRSDPLRSPPPAYLKKSELYGKQDPFVVMEVGDFWCSQSEVLLNQSSDCTWHTLNASCFLSNIAELCEVCMKVSVYDCSCAGFHNIFLGSAFIPIINFIGLQQGSEATIEASIVDRKGKLNGKLQFNYSFVAADEREQWAVGVVRKVRGNGYYDILYDNGEEEVAVSKDVMRICSVISKPVTVSRKSLESTSIVTESKYLQVGSKVEVNNRNQGLWFPARIVRNNLNDTYDIHSEYDIVKNNVQKSLIRLYNSAVSHLQNEFSSPLSPKSPKLKTTDNPIYDFNRSSSKATRDEKISLKSPVLLKSPPHKMKLEFEHAQEVESKFRTQDIVEVNYRGHGKFIESTIQEVRRNGHYNVVYQSGEVESDVPEDLIRAVRSNMIFNGFTGRLEKKFRVDQTVEVHCENIDIWHHARIKAVLSDNKYNVQFDDGETVYGIASCHIRECSLFTAGSIIHKPYFVEGDRVKVYFMESDHEMRSLLALKQRVKGERNKITEEKQQNEILSIRLRSIMDQALKKETDLEDFKKRIGYVPCSIRRAGNQIVDPTDIVPISSMNLLDEIRLAVINDNAHSKSDTCNVSELLPMELVNDLVCKAIVVQESLGFIASAMKDDIYDKQKQIAYSVSTELNRADKFVSVRESKEVTLRQRGNNKLDSHELFKEAFDAAESELGHINLARNLVHDENALLKDLFTKVESEVKSLTETINQAAANYDSICLKEVMLKNNDHGTEMTVYSRFPSSNFEDYESIPEEGKFFIEHKNLHNALLRANQAVCDYLEQKKKADYSAKIFNDMNCLVDRIANEVSLIIDTNQSFENQLTTDLRASSTYYEYLKAVESISNNQAEANEKESSKSDDRALVDIALTSRSTKEQTIVLLGKKREISEGKIRKSITQGDFAGTRNAMNEVADVAEEQVTELISGALDCETEIAGYQSAKISAEAQRSIYLKMKNEVLSAFACLSKLAVKLKERDYRSYEDAKNSASYIYEQYKLSADKLDVQKNSYDKIIDSLLVESQALKCIKLKLKNNLNSVQYAAYRSKEFSEQNHRSVAISNDRIAVEKKIQHVSALRKLEEGKVKEETDNCLKAELEYQKFSSIQVNVDTDFVYSANERESVLTAASHARMRCEALVAAKDLASDEGKLIESARKLAEDELLILSALCSLERDYMKQYLIRGMSISECSYLLGQSKPKFNTALQQLTKAKEKSFAELKNLDDLKFKSRYVLEALDQFLKSEWREDVRESSETPSDVKSYYEKARVAKMSVEEFENAARTAHLNFENAEARANASGFTKQREESIAKKSIFAAANSASSISDVNEYDQNDDSEICTALFAAVVHSESQIDAIQEAIHYLEIYLENLSLAQKHMEEIRNIAVVIVIKEHDGFLASYKTCFIEYDNDFNDVKRQAISTKSAYDSAKDALNEELHTLEEAIADLESNIEDKLLRNEVTIELYREYCKAVQLLVLEKSNALEIRKLRVKEETQGSVAAYEREVEETNSANITRQKNALLQALVEKKSSDYTDSDLVTLKNNEGLMNDVIIALSAAKEYALAEDLSFTKAYEYLRQESEHVSNAKHHAKTALAILQDERNKISKVSDQAPTDVFSSVDYFYDNAVLDSISSFTNIYEQEVAAFKQEVYEVNEVFKNSMIDRNNAEELYHSLDEVANREQSVLLELMKQNREIDYHQMTSDVVSPEIEVVRNVLNNVQSKLQSQIDSISRSSEMRESELHQVNEELEKRVTFENGAEAYEKSALEAQKSLQNAVQKKKRVDAESALNIFLKYAKQQIKSIEQARKSIYDETSMWRRAADEVKTIVSHAKAAQETAADEKRILQALKSEMDVEKSKVAYQKANNLAESYAVQYSNCIVQTMKTVSREYDIGEILETSRFSDYLHQFQTFEGNAIRYRKDKSTNVDKALVAKDSRLNDQSTVVEARQLRKMAEELLLDSRLDTRSDDYRTTVEDIQTLLEEENSALSSYNANIATELFFWNAAKDSAEQEAGCYKSVLDSVKANQSIIEQLILETENKILELKTKLAYEAYTALKSFVAVKVLEVTPAYREKPQFVEFEKIMAELEDTDEPLIRGLQQVRSSTIPKAEALAQQKKKEYQRVQESATKKGSSAASSAELQRLTEMENEARRSAAEIEKDELVAWQEVEKLTSQALLLLNAAIEKANLALQLLESLRIEGEKEKLIEEKRRIEAALNELQVLRLKGTNLMAEADKQGKSFQDVMTSTNEKVEELREDKNTPIISRESLMRRIESYQQIQQLQTEIENECEPYIQSWRQRKLTILNKIKSATPCDVESTLSAIAEESVTWNELITTVEEELKKLSDAIVRAKNIVRLLDAMKADKIERERQTLGSHLSDIQKMRNNYDDSVASMKSLAKSLDDVIVQIMMEDGDLTPDMKMLPLYQQFLQLSIELEDDKALNFARQGRLAAASKADKIAQIRVREEKIMDKAAEEIVELNNVALNCYSAGDLYGDLAARTEANKWSKKEQIAIIAAIDYAIEEKDVWLTSDDPLQQEIVLLNNSVEKAKLALRILKELKIETKKRAELEKNLYDLSEILAVALANAEDELTALEDAKRNASIARTELNDVDEKIRVVGNDLLDLNKDNEDSVATVSKKGFDFIDDVEQYKKNQDLIITEYQQALSMKKNKENDRLEAEKSADDLDHEENSTASHNEGMSRAEKKVTEARATGDKGAELQAVKEINKYVAEQRNSCKLSLLHTHIILEKYKKATGFANTELEYLIRAKRLALDSKEKLKKALLSKPRRTKLGSLIFSNGDGLFEGSGVRPVKNAKKKSTYDQASQMMSDKKSMSENIFDSDNHQLKSDEAVIQVDFPSIELKQNDFVTQVTVYETGIEWVDKLLVDTKQLSCNPTFHEYMTTIADDENMGVSSSMRETSPTEGLITAELTKTRRLYSNMNESDSIISFTAAELDDVQNVLQFAAEQVNIVSDQLDILIGRHNSNKDKSFVSEEKEVVEDTLTLEQIDVFFKLEFGDAAPMPDDAETKLLRFSSVKTQSLLLDKSQTIIRTPEQLALDAFNAARKQTMTNEMVNTLSFITSLTTVCRRSESKEGKGYVKGTPENAIDDNAVIAFLNATPMDATINASQIEDALNALKGSVALVGNKGL